MGSAIGLKGVGKSVGTSVVGLKVGNDDDGLNVGMDDDGDIVGVATGLCVGGDVVVLKLGKEDGWALKEGLLLCFVVGSFDTLGLFVLATVGKREAVGLELG